MNTSTINALVTVIVPLLLTSPVWAAAFNWLLAQAGNIADARLRSAVQTGVTAVAHSLAQGELLTPAHIDAALDIVQKLRPGTIPEQAKPIIRQVMHDINGDILLTGAQMQAAAARRPTVIQPDPVAVAQALIQALVVRQPPQPPQPPQAPPAPPAGPAPVPLTPVPTTGNSGSGIAMPIGTSSVPGGATVTATGTVP